MLPDLYAARRMVDAGAAAVMPLGSPIGSNRGLRTRELVAILVRELPVPVIVDAGLGRPSEAAAPTVHLPPRAASSSTTSR